MDCNSLRHYHKRFIEVNMLLLLFVMLQGVFLWLSKLERLKMFSLFKKKEKTNIVAPVSGKLIELEKVKDPVFAKKMMGDGFAIKPNLQGQTFDVYAPIDAEVVSLPSTKHAVGLRNREGQEILIHIGIDTVDLKGNGFSSYISQGDYVHQGEKLISVDDNVLKHNNLDDTVMVILVKGYANNLLINYGNKVDQDTNLIE